MTRLFSDHVSLHINTQLVSLVGQKYSLQCSKHDSQQYDGVPNLAMERELQIKWGSA